MWVEDGARAVLVGTELVNNTAVSSYTHKGAGGGVAVSASASLDMSDGCSLRGNVAGPEVRWAERAEAGKEITDAVGQRALC